MIYLLRLGYGEDGNGDDSTRRLTSKGKRQAREADRALAALEIVIGSCLASPELRAAERMRKGGLATVDGSTLVALLRPCRAAPPSHSLLEE